MDIGNGRYRLIRRLGSGGTGVVYQAADLALGRTVAVKAVHPAYAAELLRREGRSLARVNHASVVAIFDLVEEKGQAYLVMEYVDGCDLDRWLGQHGAMPLEQAIGVIRQIASAVRQAHACGVLHCDLKLANVLISTRGEVKLTDFTLARLAVGSRTDGVSGASPDFAAPEQLSCGAIDARTDVYGLGALLRHLLSRTALPASDEARTVQAVIERATAPDPADRYASVDEFHDALPAASASLTRLIALSPVSDLTRIAPGAVLVPLRRRRRRYLLPLALLPAAAAAAVTTLLLVRVNAVASPTTVSVPNLVARSQADARIIDHALALHTALRSAVYSSTVPAGSVVAQWPSSGARIIAGGTIKLTLSKGPQPVEIPYVLGLNQDAATARLQSFRFRVNVQTTDSISDDPGTTLSQQPDPGSWVLPNTTVTITISKHPWWWFWG